MSAGLVEVFPERLGPFVSAHHLGTYCPNAFAVAAFLKQGSCVGIFPGVRRDQT